MRRRLCGLLMVINRPPCEEDSRRGEAPELLQLLTSSFIGRDRGAIVNCVGRMGNNSIALHET
jgi:hypothetical protein